MLKQRFIDNQTYTWYGGPLNSANIRAFDAERVGLQACFYQGPIAGVEFNGTDRTSGMRIFVATSETTFDQYAWRPGLASWTKEQSSFESMNGHATPGCFGWAAGWTTYVMFVGSQNDIQLWWSVSLIQLHRFEILTYLCRRDTSYEVQGSATHPLNTWVQGWSLVKVSYVVMADHAFAASTDFGSVDPTTGLSFHANLYGKSLDSGQVQGWNITFDAENSTTSSTLLSNVFGDPAIPGSHLFAWTIPPVGVPDELLVFYQIDGDDITVYSGNPTTGEWTPTTIPIPLE